MEVSVQFQVPAALSLWKGPLVPIWKEAGWTPELVWTKWQGEKSLPLPGIKVQLYNP